jgi:hypothetical protein
MINKSCKSINCDDNDDIIIIIQIYTIAYVSIWLLQWS